MIRVWGVRKVLFLVSVIISFSLLSSFGLSTDWWDTDWSRCKNLTISNVFTANSPVYVNITGLTFTNVSKEIRIVDTSCNNAGNVVKHRIIEDSGNIGDGYEWVRIMFPASTNTVYSVYYDNPNAEYDSSLELNSYDIWDAYYNGTVNATLATDKWSVWSSGTPIETIQNIDGQLRYNLTTESTERQGWQYPTNDGVKTVEICFKTESTHTVSNRQIMLETRNVYKEIISFNRDTVHFVKAGTSISSDSSNFPVYRFVFHNNGSFNFYRNNIRIHDDSTGAGSPGGELDWGDYEAIDTGRVEQFWTYITVTDDGSFPPSSVSIGLETLYSPFDIKVTLNTPADGAYINTKNVNFTFNVFGNTDYVNITNCTLWGDFSGIWAANETNTTRIQNNVINGINNTVDSDGSYLWNIICYNATNIGNYSLSNRTVFVDTTPPISSITNESTVWVTYDEINITCSDATGCKATKWYYFDSDGICSNSKENYTSSTTAGYITVNTDHNDYLCLWVEDNTGKSDTAVSSQLKVDTTDPIASISGESTTWVQSDDIDITCSDALSSCVVTKWYYFDSNGICSTSKGSYTSSITDPNITVNTDHNDWLCLWVEDQAGNYNYTISSQLMIDATSPVLTNPIPEDGDYIQGTSTQLFKIDVSDLSFDPSKVFVYYKRTGTPVWLNQVMNCYGSPPDHTCNTPVNLYDDYAEDDVILFYFEATDMAGNEEVTETNTITIDRTPPQVIDITTNDSDNIITRYDAILLSVEWEDNYALNSAILSTNENGSWENYTSITLSGTSDWSNFIWYNPSIKRTVVAWRVYSDDKAGNEKVSEINTFTVYDTATSTAHLNSSWVKEGEAINISCRVKDSASNDIPNYPVEIYNNNSGSITFLTSGLTDASGEFNYTWTSSIPEGNNTIICAIHDNSEMFYKTISNNTASFTADYTPPLLTD